MNRILLLSFFLLFHFFFAQAGKISGIVTDDKNNILPYASVFVKGTTKGTTTNNAGRFSMELEDGEYTIVCQYIGYTRQEKKIKVSSEPVTLNFSLPLQRTTMKEVVVKPGGEDPAYEIIRHAIKKRKDYEEPLDSFTCEAYIKTLIKTRKLPSKIFGQKMKDEDRKTMGVDSVGKGIVYLSESLTKIAFKKPDRIKLEVLSGRESGSNGFGFNFPTFVNFYNNNVNVFITQLNPRGFVSPIAEGALNYYRYKYLGSFFEDGKEINKIQVTPRRKFEPLFTGTINITDGDWRIHSLDLYLVKESMLEIVDTLSIRQIHVPISPDVWRTKDQVVYFTFNKLGIDATGNFLNVYSKYDTTPEFRKKYFNNVIVKYDTAVTKKTKLYWDSVRPVQLEPEESKDYKIKDSLFETQRDSASSRRVIDSLRRKQGRVTVMNVLWNGVQRRNFDPKKPFDWSLQPLLRSAQYNTVEGVVANLEATFTKSFPESKERISFTPHIRYGFNNTHLNAWATIAFSKRNFEWDPDGGSSNRSSWIFSGGKRVSQFNNENPISPLMNEIYTLFLRDNFMKIYENYYGSATYTNRFDNGLRISGNLLYEDRMPLDNTTDFSFFGDKNKTLTPNYPYEKTGAQFTRHQALIAGVELQFKPGQRYIEFPRNKIPIGSKYPTMSLSYQKGLENIFGSDVNFDKWSFSVWDDVNFKLRGLLKYRFSIGGFFNTKSVFIQDYQHFNGNQVIFASQYLNSFQIAPYYANSTTAAFYAVGHLEHHFNGLLTNKIPLFRRLKWNLVAGSNAFYVNKDNNYVEIFGGLENIFKIMRVDVVGAYLNGRAGQVTLRVGFGGLFGAAFANASSNGGNVQIQLN
ncbi:MAG: carboxypeptidase-like regulatory domain-containing protein [Bacteroidetes bacterium]|nr:carboxypeptidase-like regulatory domain-containing protein [Bacteroidota bacterium]